MPAEPADRRRGRRVRESEDAGPGRRRLGGDGRAQGRPSRSRGGWVPGSCRRMERGMEAAHEKYDRLIARCKAIPPTPTAVVHPCDESSLRGAIDAARVGLIAPILVGPSARIRDVAQKSGLDISSFRIVEAAYSQDSAARAVELVRNAEAQALMKGSLHTDELMAAVVKKDTGLRTARRISHCFIMDVPGHPSPLLITDAAVNIAPTLKDKIDIVQ